VLPPAVEPPNPPVAPDPALIDVLAEPFQRRTSTSDGPPDTHPASVMAKPPGHATTCHLGGGGPASSLHLGVSEVHVYRQVTRGRGLPCLSMQRTGIGPKLSSGPRNDPLAPLEVPTSPSPAESRLTSRGTTRRHISALPWLRFSPRGALELPPFGSGISLPLPLRLVAFIAGAREISAEIGEIEVGPPPREVEIPSLLLLLLLLLPPVLWWRQASQKIRVSRWCRRRAHSRPPPARTSV